jgi:hypothetical protein
MCSDSLTTFKAVEMKRGAGSLISEQERLIDRQ